MRIRRFEAPDTTTALAMIKKEMGEDAVILSTRPISNGKNGKKPWLEVVAAMDSDIEALVNMVPPAQPQEPPIRTYTDRAARQPPAPTTAMPERPSSAPAKPAPPIKKDSPPSLQDFGQALPNEIRSEARELRQRFSRMVNRRNDAGTATAKPTGAPSSQAPSRPNPEEVALWREQIINRIQVTPITLPPDRQGPIILALVGSTGVGKTTTAAKLAAWFSLREHARVTLISMDCYRIGATDQLRTYARIMRLPCELALRKKDLNQTIARHAEQDVIIIDTAGKSPYDQKHIAELSEWFSGPNLIRPLLLLPATAKKEDLATIIAAYTPLKTTSLILTKLDETRAYAALCQQVATGDTPVSCVCTGQRVPEDFLPASRSLIEKLFMEGWDAAVPEMTSLFRKFKL
ncbi:MAG: flagellar biosynthesis protein FlhF [Deltaproteobacteria bacterium RIFOXYD12_FULL_50_9]|nr:MAG: flagellar biosynthesis protein FlhF [Deltaproteobacteria bacterium RIFOXYD12_FULL_50_9]